MPVSAQRIKGKLKRDIADEAFKKLGKNATIQQVDAYFKRHYGIAHCERSMWSAARRRAQGKISPPPRRYRRHKRGPVDVADIVGRARQLAYELGGYDKLEELAASLREKTT